MKTFLRLSLLLLLTATSLQAQVSTEIINILDKCEATDQSNPAGVENVISLTAGVPLLKFKGTINAYSKGKKEVAQVSMKVLGKEVKYEWGYDGSQYWEFRHSLKDNVPDTLYIAPKRESQDEFDYELNIYKDYNNASMKLKKGVYEITLTDPKNKEVPKKTVVRINQPDYRLLEMEMKQGMATIEMTFDKVNYGVSDSRFILDPKNYPGAVVIRKDAL